MLYDVHVVDMTFYDIDAENENEAKEIALAMYYNATGLSVYSDDDRIRVIEKDR